MPLEDLLAESHAVTLHVSLNDAAHHLIDAGRLAQMRTGAILVNRSPATYVACAQPSQRGMFPVTKT